MIVIKRDGREVEFDVSKILSAINRAVISAGDGVGVPRKVADKVLEALTEENKEKIDIEHIQDLVEKFLMESNPIVAKCYILYRNNRSQERMKKTEINKKIAELIKIDASESDTKRENANIDGDTMCGSMLKIGGTVTKEYFFDNIVDSRFKDLHNNGQIHIHDADLALFTINCLHIGLKKLLAEGFSTGHGYLRSPTTIQSAATLACIALQSNQNDCFGGQAYPSIDYDLAPYVAKSFVRNVLEHLRSILTLTETSEAFSHSWLKKYVLPVFDQYIKEHDHILTENGYSLVYDTLRAYLDVNHSTFKLNDEVFEKIKNYALEKTDRDTYQAMEAMQHNFCTLQSRSGGQTPFSSVNFGTDTSEEGRMVSKNILLNVRAGLGSGETAIFPISIFKILKGVTDKGHKNYDLFRLACEVSAVRAFPNFVNVSAPMNLKYYVPGRPETEIATMGCVHGSEVSLWKINGNITLATFAEMKSKLSDCQLIPYSHKSCYIDFEKENTELKIWDSHSNDFVGVKKFIVNTDVTNWRTVQFTNGRNITVTGDHPLPVVNKGRISVDEMCVGDKVPLTASYPKLDIIDKPNSQIDYYWLLGMIICDAAIVRNSVIISVGNDEVDLLSEIQKHATVLDIHDDGRINVWAKHQERGVKGTYYDIVISGMRHASELAQSFGGFRKIERHIPDFILQNTTREEKLAFLAGMIDADGYVNNRRKNARVQIGSTNKALAYGQMIIAEYLGLQAKVYHNHYTSKHDNIRYRVEFFITEELASYLRSTKKINHSTGFSGVCSDVENAEVVNINMAPAVEDNVSYDVETESDRFDFSGIQSHNCRTRVIGNHYDKNHQQTSGRGNLFFTTINLPYIALEALEKYPDDEEARYAEFMKILDERIDDAMEVNRQRFEYISHRKAKNLPFLMGQHLYIGSENLGPEDEIGDVIRQGSISVGFIGLAETLTALFGKHHGESAKSQEYGLAIISHMNDLMHKFSEEENMNYSLFATPAEGCSGRLLKACRKRFGIVPGVTDKEYLTNSSHVPVGYKISAFDKINIEAPYHPLCEAGIIGYIELDYDATKNVDAFETLVNYMADSGMTYFSINHPVDHDPVCGYFGYIPIGGVCPRCGRKEGEGVSVRKLLSLKSYSPTPEFAIDRSMLELEDVVPNDL